MILTNNCVPYLLLQVNASLPNFAIWPDQLGQCVQEIIYIVRLIKALALKVRKPMMINSENKGAVDLVT